MTGYEKKPVSLITTTAGMAATVTAMIVGSLFGVSGTLWGAALGSGVAATAGTVYENAARKTHARLRAVREQEQAETRLLPGGLQDRMLAMPHGRENLIRSRAKRIMLRERNPWKTALVGSAMMTGCFALALVTLLVIESASGRTLHSLTTGNRQYGTSFSYSTKAPPKPSPSLSIIPSTSSPTSTTTAISPTATPDASPDASPDATPSTSGSPTATGSP